MIQFDYGDKESSSSGEDEDEDEDEDDDNDESSQDRFNTLLRGACPEEDSPGPDDTDDNDEDDEGNSANVPELDEGETMLLKGAVATMLTGSDWVDKIKAAATKIVMKFGDARWYIGSQLRNNREGLWAMYE
jgi:hypothetical protein